MAMNPMQRKARNSFLTGVLVTLIVMAIIVVLLFSKIKQLNEEKDNLIALQKTYYVTAADVKSGDEITVDSIIEQTVQTTVSEEKNLTPADFYEIDEDGNELLIEYMSILDLPAGTIITKDMVAEAGEELTSDQRIQEYSMISLPSQLVEGDYIDIRFEMPTGTDFIVLPKKKVLQCTADTIWLKLTEAEILTLNSVIVESYQSVGTKLYALKYIEAGRQKALEPTYTVNQSVISLIEKNPNIVTEAKNALIGRYNDNIGMRESQINSVITIDNNSVNAGFQSEITAKRSAREAFVSELDGGGDYSE